MVHSAPVIGRRSRVSMLLSPNPFPPLIASSLRPPSRECFDRQCRAVACPHVARRHGRSYPKRLLRERRTALVSSRKIRRESPAACAGMKGATASHARVARSHMRAPPCWGGEPQLASAAAAGRNRREGAQFRDARGHVGFVERVESVFSSLCAFSRSRTAAVNARCAETTRMYHDLRLHDNIKFAYLPIVNFRPYGIV